MAIAFIINKTFIFIQSFHCFFDLPVPIVNKIVFNYNYCFIIIYIVFVYFLKSNKIADIQPAGITFICLLKANLRNFVRRQLILFCLDINVGIHISPSHSKYNIICSIIYCSFLIYCKKANVIFSYY